jgi:predicted Zn-dependent protease
MKRLITFLATLVLLTGLVVAEPYNHASEGFSITPPEGWSVKDEELGYGTALILNAPGDDAYAPSVYVMIQRGEYTPKDFFERQEMMLEGTAVGLTYKDATLAGRPGGWYGYTVNNSLRTDSTFVSKGDKVFIVACSARVAEFEANEKIFQAVLDSFTLE